VLLLDVSKSLGPDLHLDVVHHNGLSSTWTCLDTRACAAPGCIDTTGALSTLRRPVLHLDVYTQQGTELHLDTPGQQEPMLLPGMSTPQGSELHLNFSTLQRSVLHHGRVYSQGAYATPGLVKTTGAYSAPGHAHTSGV
jgi:hypothetical protein